MKNTMILQRAEVRIIACHQTGPAWSIKPGTISWERAGNRVRTDDLLITNQLLYQLSYAGIYEGKASLNSPLSRAIVPPICTP